MSKNKTAAYYFGRVLHYVRPWFLRYAVGMLALTSMGFWQSYVVARFTQSALLLAEKGSGLWQSMGIFLLLILMIHTLGMTGFYVMNYAFNKAAFAMNAHLMEKITLLNGEQIDASSTGEMLSAFENDAGASMQALGGNMQALLSTVISGIGGFTVILLIDFKLALYSLGIGIFSLVITVIMAKPIRRLNDEIFNMQAEATSRITDSIEGGAVIRVFSAGKRIFPFLENPFKNIRLSEIKMFRYRVISLIFSPFQRWLSFAGVLILGGGLFAGNVISLDKLLVVMGMCGQIIYFFTNIGSVWTGMQRTLAGSSRVFDLIDTPYTERQSSESTQLNKIANVDTADTNKANVRDKAEILKVSGLTYSYSGQDSKTPAVCDVDFKVGRGEVVALVGTSGCGKSTVLKLLMGFLEAQKGEFFLIGTEKSAIGIELWREKIAYVSQGGVLLPCSLFENISSGDYFKTSKENVERAAKALNIHEAIMSKGYDSDAFSTEGRLSEGQTQRVHIARASVREAELILMDEPSSSLDKITQNSFISMLDEWRNKGKGVLIVSHSKELIAAVDRVIFMNNGKIVCSGKHQDMYLESKEYKECFIAAET